MAYTTIDDGSKNFQTATYTGTGSGFSVTNSGNSNLKPDWVWVKDRGATNDHKLTDSMRLNSSNQPTLTLESNTSAAEYDDSGEGSDATTSFNTDGFTIGTNGNYNTDGNTYVAWQWKANGGTATGSFSESGNNPAVSFQANTAAGFSICTYTGTGGNGSFAHGLGVAPEWVIIKGRDTATDGMVYHGANTSAPETDALTLPENSATSDNAGWWQDTAPTSSSVYIGTHDRVNTDGKLFIAYCFAPIQGYSKFGGYVGTGNADGPFLYTGFKPAWVMIKETGATGSWHIFDNTRKVGNVSDSILYADLQNAEATSQTGNPIDILSNGFKCRGGGNDTNLDDGTYVYMAFAEHPFVSSEGVPTTAV